MIVFLSLIFTFKANFVSIFKATRSERSEFFAIEIIRFLEFAKAFGS